MSTPVSESTSKLLLDAVASPILIFRDGHILFVNRAACSKLGCDSSMLTGSPLERWIHPDDWTKLRGWDQPGEQATTETLRFLGADQAVLTTECSVNPIRFEGQPAWMGTFLPLDEARLSHDETAGLEDAHAALFRIRERFDILAEHMKDFIVEISRDGTVLYISPSCKRVLGFNTEDLTRSRSLDLVHPDDVERVDQMIRTTLEGGEDHYAVLRVRHRNGSYVWLEASGSVVRQESGEIRSLIAVCRDVTARKLAEDALREAESMMRQVMELVPVDIYIYGVAEQCNIFHNRKTNLGYHLQDMAEGSDVYYGNFVHPDDRAIFDEKTRRLAEAKDGEIIDSEHRMWHADGQWRWIAFHDMVFKRDGDGKPTQFLGYFQDVTERREVEAALRVSEEKLRTIADNMHDMVSMVDPNLVFNHVSQAHRAALGYEPDDLIGQSAMDYVHPDDFELVLRSAQAAFQRRDGDMIEFRFKHADGYYVWMETTGRVMTDSAGNVTGAVFTSRDISERRWMQRAMVEQERLVTALQKEQELGGLMQRMMARLSHELRTPLAVIGSSTDLLEYYSQRMNETQRGERLHQIRGQVRALTGMLDNMSLVVKGLAFSSDFSASPYDLERLSRQVIEDVPKLLKATQTIDLRLNGPASRVQADEHLMRLILTHLLSNALKYSSADSLVEIEMNASAEAIELKVSDHGVGILPDERERIFEPFFRGTNINEAPGLGIGLSIVEKAVASHHGSIEVASEPGQGTRVTVKLPLNVD
ncbi:MAG: PAS domain S-box protein [Anaerolineae bacterium]|nr:PAS domain S-box protein [Anaerolineae bacterium]